MLPFTKIKPAFPECDHCVVFCSDDNYMAPTSVAVQSIINHASEAQFYDILILHGEVIPEHENKFKSLWHGILNVSVRFINIAPLFEGLNLYTENRTHFSREAYFRLVIPWVLSEEYTKALYLDGDMMLRHDLTPIFDIDIDHKFLGAVKDYWGICNCYRDNDPCRRYRLSIGLDDVDHYVISATLLFNLKMWRNRFSMQQVIRLCASKKWLQHDQDVVNILCQGCMVYLSPTWGMMEDYGNNYLLPEYMLEELSEIESDPAIVHFGGTRKPYLGGYVNYDIEFWMCADKTPYMKDLLERISSEEYRNYVIYTIACDKIELRKGEYGVEAVYKDVTLGLAGTGWQKYKVIRIQGESLHIEVEVGYFGLQEQDKIDIFLMKGSKRIDKDNIHRELIQNKHLHKVYHACVAIFNISLNDNCFELKLLAEINGKITPLSECSFDQYCELSGCFKREYYTNGGWVVHHSDDRMGLVITRSSKVTNFKREVSFLSELLLKKDQLGGKKSVVLRLITVICRSFLRKPIWLVSDRVSHADDNGEVFYRYLKKNHSKDVKAFFLLHPKSKDYDRLKKELGGIIAPYSWTHKLLALLSEWSISSQTDYLYRDPFRDYGQPYRSVLRKTRFTFLQHGVISNDCSRWLDKDIQELDGFITSTSREYESVIRGNYHYTREQVWMTGMPRFDRLTDKREKTITVMPTWRLYLFIGQNHDTGEWILKKGFEHSKYTEFYRKLMNHRRLRQAAEENGYRLQFKVHPVFLSHTSEFGFDESVNIVPPEISYAEIYNKSSLVVTDYSSSVYDFVYLKKPVIYCQFDEDEFFSGIHAWDKGDFDYEKDGFGEVLNNLEDTVDTMIRYIETGCALREPYRTRIEEAFPDRKPDHCERIYRTIESIG